MKLHILSTQNALKISTLISLLFSYCLSSTIFSLCYAYFTTVIDAIGECQNQLARGPNKSGGRQLGTLE